MGAQFFDFKLWKFTEFFLTNFKILGLFIIYFIYFLNLLNNNWFYNINNNTKKSIGKYTKFITNYLDTKLNKVFLRIKEIDGFINNKIYLLSKNFKYG